VSVDRRLRRVSQRREEPDTDSVGTPAASMELSQLLTSRPRQPNPRPDRPLRRAADRHYLAVVADEARRLARQLKPSRRAAESGRRPGSTYPYPEGLH
jgi:hypothetical protein